MSTLSTRTLWCLVVALSAAVLGIAGWNWMRCSAAERTQTLRLARITSHARTLSELQSQLPAWTFATKPAGTLAPEVSATLAASGLPASAMASLAADPESAGVGGGGGGRGASNSGIQVRDRHATLVLGSVTLPQLGTFLQNWRQRQPAWTISMVDVSPEPNAAAAKAQTGGDLPLHAVLTMQTLTLERSGGVR